MVQLSLVNVHLGLRLAVKWQDGGTTVAANNRDLERLGIGIAAQGVGDEGRGTDNIKGCHAEEASRVKGATLFEGLGGHRNR